MDCQRARELVEKHIKFLATLEGEKVATKEEILTAFRHVKNCSRAHCLEVWQIVFQAAMEFDQEKQSPGWDGDY